MPTKQDLDVGSLTQFVSLSRYRIMTAEWLAEHVEVSFSTLAACHGISLECALMAQHHVSVRMPSFVSAPVASAGRGRYLVVTISQETMDASANSRPG